MTKGRILLIFPRLGPYDRVIKDMPLSLIYAARLAQKDGFSVTIIDQRLKDNWRREVARELKERPVMAGISVMTGRPIGYALEISKFIKDNSQVPVVWGGVHPTIMPEQTLLNKNIDILVRGMGEATLGELARALVKTQSGLGPVKGISFKDAGRQIHNEPRPDLELASLGVPDYNLVNYNDYVRFESTERFFSILTSRGCPHHCGFCYSVNFEKSGWQPEPVERIIEHLELVLREYRPTYFSIIDSDFFVDPIRVRKLLEYIERKRWGVTFGFRGVRVDELYRVDSGLLSLMEKAGVRHLHIGAESGSQRMLDLMKKGIKVGQTIEVNRRLGNFKGLIPTYNFFSGIPTETKEDIKQTTGLIVRLIKENANCLITAYNQFTPYPGTELFDLAVKHGLRPPGMLEEWIDYDQSRFATLCPWLTKERKKLLGMLYITSIFIDKKISSLFISSKLSYKILRLFALLYRPVARFRLKNHFSGAFLENIIRNALKW